jgi:spermidine/putrescine-binding protein
MNRSTRIGLIALMALVAAACGNDDSGTDAGATGGDGDGESAACEVGETDGDLALYNWSEYMDPDLVAQFEDEHGVTVTEDFYPSNEEMLARIQQGASFDVIVPSDYMVSVMIEDGLLLPLDRDAIPNIENLADRFASDLPYDPDLEYSAPYQWGTTGLGVDLDVVGEDVPRTWGLVFDPDLSSEYAGRITLLDDPRETIGAALKYLGYSLNSTDLDELAEAESLVADAIPRLAAFDSDQFSELLVAGESAVAHGFSGGFFTSFDESDGNYDYFVPDEGGTVWVDNMAIPADAPNPCTAHAFVNFILDAENGAALTNWTYYASPNEAAEEFIEPEILEDEAIYPDPELDDNLEFIEDTGDFEINFTDALSRARG